MSANKITPSDFFGGFFAALSAMMPGRTILCGERFNEAVKAAYDRFSRRAKKDGKRTTFLIQLDRLHGDSSVIDEGIAIAIRRDLISLDNPSFEKFRLKMDAEEANQLLPTIPGGEQIYREAAKEFIQEYSSSRVLV